MAKPASKKRPWWHWIVAPGMAAFVIVISLYRYDYIGQDGDEGWPEAILIGVFAFVFVVAGYGLYREEKARRRRMRRERGQAG